MQLYLTDLGKGLYWQPQPLTADAPVDANHMLCLYPEITRQRFDGFGGAFTEAAGITWAGLTRETREEFLEAYFSKTGLGYTLGRVHMGSCDFSLGNYSCVEDPMDEGLERFSLERDRANLFPLLKAACAAAGAPLGLMLSPWSPPPFMKTNGEMNHGGRLKPEYYGRWAACIAQYVQRYRDEGFDVRMVSVQNEPDAVQTWDSCIYSAEEEALFAGDYLAPALDAVGCGNVNIFVWDHNKEQLLHRARGSLNTPQGSWISGLALHWYTGDHFDAVRLTAEQFPDKALYFTEGCVEYSRFGGMSDLEKAEMYAHDIIGNLNAGIHGSLDWNLLLDKQGGPNHVGNFCEAPVMADGRGRIERKGSYWYIGHFSRFIRPGAVRMELSRWCAELETTAFQNPDGSLAVVLLNRSGKPLPVWMDCFQTAFVLPAHTIATVIK